MPQGGCSLFYFHYHSNPTDQESKPHIHLLVTQRRLLYSSALLIPLHNKNRDMMSKLLLFFCMRMAGLHFVHMYFFTLAVATASFEGVEEIQSPLQEFYMSTQWTGLVWFPVTGTNQPHFMFTVVSFRCTHSHTCPPASASQFTYEDMSDMGEQWCNNK